MIQSESIRIVEGECGDAIPERVSLGRLISSESSRRSPSLLGCHFNASGRDSADIANLGEHRADFTVAIRIVLTCSLSSDPMPRGNATWNCWAAAGALATSTAASAGLAVRGALVGAAAALVGAAASAFGAQHRGFVSWA